MTVVKVVVVVDGSEGIILLAAGHGPLLITSNRKDSTRRDVLVGLKKRHDEGRPPLGPHRKRTR